MAPLARLSVGKATTRSASNTSVWPMPSQAGQAPSGELNENRRGSSSPTVWVQTGQANLAEKACSAPLSMFTVSARPSARRRAASKLSANLWRCGFVPSSSAERTLMRSITTSMLCFSDFFSGGRASASNTSPPMRKRT